jgi:S1-C subfamily serine protease
MRTRLLALLLLLAIGCYRYRAMPKPTMKAPTSRYHGYALNRAAIRHMKTLTVLISAEGFRGIERGTGVLIDSRHILTCAHVALNEGDDTLVYFYPGYMLGKAKTVYADRAKDLAIMELDVEARAPGYVKFQEEHYDGQPITIVGNILGSMKWFVSYGIVSGEGGEFLYTDGLIRGGNSGGPWINEKGEIVALTDWGLSSVTGKELGIGGGVSAKTVNEFIASWKNPSFLDTLLGGLK